MSSKPPHHGANSANSDRSIMYTIDAVLMALVLFAGLGVIFHVVPDRGSLIQEDFGENQMKSDANDVLSISEESGNLKDGLLYWDDSQGKFVNSGSDGTYVLVSSSHPLHESFRVLQDRGFGISLGVQYQTASGVVEQKSIIQQGTPGEESATVETTIVIEDDDTLVGPDSGTRVTDANTYFAPDASPESGTYNVLTVYLTIWWV